MRGAFFVNLSQCLFVAFHSLSLNVKAENEEGVGVEAKDGEKFYCDDSADALDDVPAERSCTDLAGQNRCWFTYTPEVDEQETVPLLLDLHGFGGCAGGLGELGQSAYSGWRELAGEDNFYVVWPQGTNNIFYSLAPCWNAGSCCCYSFFDIPDSDLLMEIIQKTVRASNGRIDPNRIYMGGHSNGCFMSQRFVKDYPGVLAAVACHAGVTLVEHPSNDDPDWVPTTIVNIHGDQDGTVPYYDSSSFGLGAEENNDLWAEANDCTKKTISPPDPNNEYITHTWTGCSRSVSTQLIQVIGGDHSPFASYGWVDTTSMAWDYIKTISRAACSGGQVYASIEITTDQNPSETSWTLARGTVDNIVADGGDYTEQNFKYTFGGCSRPQGNTCFTFTIYDSAGDGLSGDGGFAIYVDGDLVVDGSIDSGLFEKSFQFGVC